MKIYCGTDIIEIDRIKKYIEKNNDALKNRVYTEKEINYCESKNNQKYQHYAARFAAKEAVFKALSDSLNNKYDIEWKDIEIENDEQGRPKVNINTNKFNFKIENIDISMSHCKEYATATAIVLI